MKNREVQERPGLGRRLCCIAIVGMLFAAGFGIAIDILVADVTGGDLVVTETITPGTVGSTIAISPSESYTDLILLNDSSFNRESGWKLDYNELNEYDPKLKIQSKESGIEIDISNIVVEYSYDMNFNLRDYENITFSLDVNVLNGPIEVVLSLEVYSLYSIPQFFDYGHYGDSSFLILTTGESATLYVELNTDALYGTWNPLWLAQSVVGVSIYPISSNSVDWGDSDVKASVQIENATVTATSTIPLSPLIVDVQNTQGFSIYESGLISAAFPDLVDLPAINLTSDEIPEKWGIFILWKSNDTVYVPVSNYSGIAGFCSLDYLDNSFAVFFEVFPNNTLSVGLRFEMVRVDLSVSQAVPYLSVSVWYINRDRVNYGFAFVPPFPDTFYIPKRNGTLFISIVVPPRVENAYRTSQNSVRIQVSNPVDIDLQLRFGLFSFAGIMLSTGEILLIFLSFALLMGAFLSIQKPSSKKQWRHLVRDPRFWPAFLVGVSALVPWFTSSSLNKFVSITGEAVTIHKSLYIPFALGLESTANSLTTLVVSPYVLLDIPIRIILFWLPLKWTFGYTGNPEKWKFNSYYAICLILPLFMGVMTYLFTPIHLALSIGFFLVLIAPILWGFAILIYRGSKRRKK